MKKNIEKYKTTEERKVAFQRFCNSFSCAKRPSSYTCPTCPLSKESTSPDTCALEWLDLDCGPDILPCPFCGDECELHEIWDNEMCRSAGCDVRCTSCEYRSPEACKHDGSDAIEAHNRVARAVMKAGKEPEE